MIVGWKKRASFLKFNVGITVLFWFFSVFFLDIGSVLVLDGFVFVLILFENNFSLVAIGFNWPRLDRGY